MTKTRSQRQQFQKKTPPPQKSKGNIILCWCDGGTTDGKFTEGLVYSILTSELPIKSAMRVQGNQIGRQRQQAFDYWYDNTDFEWILWIDSDIAMNNEALAKVWLSADAKERPVVSGIYFVSKENEQSLMAPYAAVFNWTDDPHKISYIHPLPKDVLIQIGSAGFGFVLMHRNAAKTMRDKLGMGPFFNETGVGQQFVSEDINFFRHMAEAGVPLYAHTGAVVKHMKRFSYDVDYYQLYWNSHTTNPRFRE